jgi:hypothetical protein
MPHSARRAARNPRWNNAVEREEACSRDRASRRRVRNPDGLSSLWTVRARSPSVSSGARGAAWRRSVFAIQAAKLAGEDRCAYGGCARYAANSIPIFLIASVGAVTCAQCAVRHAASTRFTKSRFWKSVHIADKSLSFLTFSQADVQASKQVSDGPIPLIRIAMWRQREATRCDGMRVANPNCHSGRLPVHIGGQSVSHIRRRCRPAESVMRSFMSCDRQSSEKERNRPKEPLLALDQRQRAQVSSMCRRSSSCGVSVDSSRAATGE